MSSTGHLSELDLLRGQVADLSRELAERDRAAQDLREQSDLLRAIVAGTAAETGEEFFASLVTHLTSVLHVQYAIIGEVQGDHIKKIRTLAVSAGCHLIDNFEYELAHTPCATALTQSFACFHRDVQATFPQFQRLADLAAESYCAVPLRTKSGAVIGLLVVMDTKPLQHSDSLQSLLGVFAPRIAAEFERKRAEQERAQAQAQADLHNVIETIPDVVFALNRQGNLVKWNRRLTVVTGYSPEELLNKSALAFVPPEEQASTAAAIQRVFTEGYAELEGHMQTKDHRLIPYHWTGALLKNSHGEPVGITGIGRDVSEKKRAEEELKQQRGHLLDAQALAHLGSWAWDIDSGKEQWSDEQFRIFGYEPGTIAPTYDTFLTALHPDDYDRVLAAINDALVGKRAYDVEYRIIRPNGEVRFIHARGDSHRDATGDPLRMAGTVLDITESKRAEEALWESEARFRSMADIAPVLIWMSDTGKLCTYFNQRWLDYTGRTMEQELGNGWAEGVHPDDLDRCLKTYVEAFDRHESFQMEYRLRKLDGQYGWLLDNGVPRQLPSGKFAGYIGSCIDITDQKQTQEALAQSERQLRTVLDALPVGVWFTDRSGKPLFGNPAAKEMWSNTKQIGLQTENNQAGWWETVGSANEPHRWALSHVLATGVPSLNETFDLECLDGTKKTIRNSTVPVQDGDGNILGAIVLNEDITLLRQAQAALQLTQFSVDHAVEGFFWIGPDARIFHVNDSACRMLEYTWEELTTMTLHDIDPNLSSEVWPAHWEELKEKGSLTFESKYWSRTGRVLDIEVTVNYLQYERKEYICAIMRDIEERRRGEAALHASEERYRVLFDETPTMYFTLATDGTVRSVNRFGAEQLGYRAEELIGHSVLGIFHEGDKETVAANLSECLATPETTRHWEFRKLRKDGSIIWVRETVRVGESSAGETIVLVACEDVTERRRTVQALTFFRTLLDYVGDSIEIIDPQTGQFLDGNRGAATNIGYTRDEFLALTVPDIDPLVTGPVFAGMMERLREAPDPIILDSIHRRKDGTTFPVEVSAQLIRLDKEYLVAIVRDITERKRAEHESHRRAVEALAMQRTLLELAHLDDTELTFSEVIQNVTAVVAETLAVERASLWLLSEDRTELVCQDLYERSQAVHSTGLRLRASNYPRYFSAIEDSLVVAASDALVDPRTSEFAEGYLLPLEIASMMDVAIHYQGTLIGVACYEHVGSPREWTPEAQGFAASVNESVVRILETAKRKQAEKTLLESKQRYKTLVESAPFCIHEIDLEGRLLSMNPAGLGMMGVMDEQEIISLNYLEVVAQEDRERIEALLARACAGEASAFDFLVHSGGGVRHVASCFVPIKGEEGVVAKLMGITQDITERKQAEEAVKASEQRLRDILDSMFAFVGLFSTDGILLDANKAPLEATGLTRDEVIGRPFADIYCWSYSTAIQAELRAALSRAAQGEIVRYDVPVRIRNEQLITIDVAFAPLFNKQGQVTQIVGSAVDITDRKRMEETLRQREHALRAAIEERERISQDLHDGILQSLFAVGLTLEVSKSMMSTRVRKTSEASLNQAIDQLNDVMGEIRNFIAGLGCDLLEGKDLSMALQRMLALLTKNRATRVRLAVEDRAAKAVSAEQSLHLFRVIQEAVSNCIRHGHAQEARVSLKMLKQGVRLSIRDNGRGFKQGAAQKTGHGLANMAARAEKLGGRFTVLSKVNAGTSIVLDLPKEVSDVPR